MTLCADIRASQASTRSCCCCCSCRCHSTANIATPRTTNSQSTERRHDTAEVPSSSSAASRIPTVVYNNTNAIGSSTCISNISNSQVADSEVSPQVCPECSSREEASCGQQPWCRCSQCCSCSCVFVTTSHLSSLLKSFPFLSRLPTVTEETDEEMLAEAITQAKFPGSFAWSRWISPCGYARLCRAGFLPIAESFERSGSGSSMRSSVLLLPKLHLERMCLLLRTQTVGLPSSKNLRRKSRNFLVSVDKSFDEVLVGCVRRHGENWLWEPVRQCLRALHRQTLKKAWRRLHQESETSSPNVESSSKGTSHGQTREEQQKRQRAACPTDVEVHSFEVWAPLSVKDEIKFLPLTPQQEKADQPQQQRKREAAVEDEIEEALESHGVLPRMGDESTAYKGLCLVAGEVGVSIGRVYTSLTAFTDADSAGTAQLTATQLLLRKAGYELLDLGMHLPYKESLGAQPLPREVFLKLFRRLRDRQAAQLDATMEACIKLVECFQATTPHQNKSAKPSERYHEGGPTKTQNPVDSGKCNRGRKSTSENSGCVNVAVTDEINTGINTCSLPPGFVGCRELLQALGKGENERKEVAQSGEKRVAEMQRQQSTTKKI